MLHPAGGNVDVDDVDVCAVAVAAFAVVVVGDDDVDRCTKNIKKHGLAA